MEELKSILLNLHQIFYVLYFLHLFDLNCIIFFKLPSDALELFRFTPVAGFIANKAAVRVLFCLNKYLFIY
jgi:hypothetical protein